MQLTAPKPSVEGYEILQEIGHGATATVYKAVSSKTGHFVALKLFHPLLIDRHGFLKRIQSEFKALGLLNHANIVKTVEAIDTPAIKGIAMEYIEGESLAQLQNELPYILPELSVCIAIEILKALEHAHAHGIIHRDLKPSNILVSKDCGIYVTDFGLAKFGDASSSTITGTILGSPDFMAPEQARGEAVLEASDIFSTAAILYNLVTGTKPFAKTSMLATLTAVQKAETEFVTQRNPKISANLASIIHKGLSASPQSRFASAKDFRQALERYLEQIGLGGESFNLKTWKASKSDFIYKSLHSIAEKLTHKAQAHIRNGQTDAAMSILSHLSLIAPDSETLHLLLSEVQRPQNLGMSSSRKKTLAFSLVLLLIFGVMIFASKRFNDTPPAQPEAPDVAAKTTVEQTPPASALQEEPENIPPPQTAKTLQPERPRVDTQSKRQNPKNLQNEESTPVAVTATVTPDTAKRPLVDEVSDGINNAWNKTFPKAQVNYQRIRIDVPDDVTLYFDGKEIDVSKPFYAKPGKHKIRLHKKGFKPITQNIDVREDEPTLIRVD